MPNPHHERLADFGNSGLVYAYAYGTCVHIMEILRRKGTTKHEALKLYDELNFAVQQRNNEILTRLETPIVTAPTAVPGPSLAPIYEPEDTVSSRDESQGEQVFE